MSRIRPRITPWTCAFAVGLVVLLADWVVVGLAGTDIPFMDQWTVEGQWLYPRAGDGSLHAGDLVRAFNGHRLFFSQLLNLSLYKWNAGWDPLVQLAVIGILRAFVAALLVRILTEGRDRKAIWLMTGITVAAFMPHLAWHVVLWGFESQIAFVIGWSLLAFHLLALEVRSGVSNVAGVAAGIAAMLSMGAGELVPWALLALALIRAVETRFIRWQALWPIAILLVAWAGLHPRHDGFDTLGPRTLAEFVDAATAMLSWPIGGSVLAAVAMNLPFGVLVAGRLMRRRTSGVGEDAVVAIGAWGVGLAFATAWARGGGAELRVGVPSRYVDFAVLLPLVNTWCVTVLWRECAQRWAVRFNAAALAWGAAVVIGWVGLSISTLRGVVLPRMRDREGPVRVIRAFVATRDAKVFVGQPRLYTPGVDPSIVLGVLDDPRLDSRLPPSLRADGLRRRGILSQAARVIFRRE